jgi:preprotein translocase subunit SecE
MPGFMSFLKESREELRKVVWPSREEVLNSTIVVLGSVVVISLFLFLVDKLFESMFDALVRLGAGS